MASVDLEYNQGFKIYNANGTRFNNLVLHKATYETVVMSLGDKISGIVYYKNNKLVVNMTEYIMYKDVKYVLVNPPTVIKEGLVSDNGELKGMTKYSFTFYHPMYMLSNFPFSDVAVDDSQKQYLSQNKTFSWIGNLTDYVAKLNKNLEGTQWKVSIGTNVTDAEKNKLSEVLSFDNNTIADALKTAYETWEIPYIIDQTYEGNKRFLIRFGLPTTEIYEVDEDGQYIRDDNNQKIPFVFKYGQGVGLKNNSRTPKNNKIVTRIAGYGSEDNIPYGYPQIRWYGSSDATQTPDGYPIYKGILGGALVNLIKHPFTRTHLMPKVYSQSLFNKVSPYLEDGSSNSNYNPNIELVDYYDADNTYPNPIKAGEPSYEIHEFEGIKPEFGSFDIDSATPYDGYSDESITQNKFLSIVDDLYTETDIKAEKTQLNALRTSFVTQQQYSAKDTSGNYEYDWSFKTDGLYKKVKYASSGANFEYVVNVGLTPATIDWEDTMDEQGNYVQSYFKVTLPALGFDLYASAAITQEMAINMRSGACIGCSFPVMVDWDDYKRNFYDKDGNFAPTGTQRNLTKYPNSTNASITLILQKETNTFGTLMPNIYQKPARGDKFVILGISLPTSYITTAEGKLETEMKKYMRDNNVYYYEYPLKFDEHFLISNEHILSQMKPNVIVNFEYAGVEQSLYIKQMSVKYNESPLPKYDITLTDDVDVVLNKIGEAIAEYRGQRQYENGRGNSETLDGNKFLRKDINDTASGTIRMLKGLQVGERFVTGLLGEGGIFRKDDDGTTYLECDRMYVRMKAYFDTVEVRRFLHSGGNRIASAAGIKCSRVEYIASNGLTTQNVNNAVKFRCYFRAEDNGAKVTNDFVIGDLAYCKETNIDTNLSQHGYWRAVVGVSSKANSSGEHWIDLSKSDCSSTLNDVPIAQDDIIQLGNKTDKTRQGAIVEYVSGEDAPSYQIYQGINTYSLDDKNYIGLGYSSETGRAYMNVYGDMFVGAKPDSVTGKSPTYIKYVQDDGTEQHNPKLTIKGVVEMLSPDDPEKTTTLDDFAKAITDDIEYLQQQVDGEIDTWFYDGVPTLNNYPANEWTTDNLKKEHIGDLYYDKLNGNAYRFIYNKDNETYSWLLLSDSAILEALRIANEAKDTADHKRRVFLTDAQHPHPTPPYDEGDLWVNAVWPYQGQDIGSTYNDEILKCIKPVPRTESGSDVTVFSIGDWSAANGYKTALSDFINNTYASFVTNIQTQVDRKAQTWYLGFDPSYSWAGNEKQHVGDLWYCTDDIENTDYKKNTTWIYQERIDPDTGETVYYWAEAAVPDEVFDMIDGKSAIYTEWGAWLDESGASSLQVRDLLIPAADIVRGNVTYKQNKVYRCTNRNTQNPIFEEIAYTDNSAFNGYINAILNGTGSSGDAATVAAAQKAIKEALGNGTLHEGGLVLTSLIGMRDKQNKVWAGINGQYQPVESGTGYKGHGIAAWYGGGMADWEVYKESHSTATINDTYAKSLFRFDGSGYLAGGNITWDAQGRVAIKDITTLVGGNNTDILNALTTFNNAFHFTTAQGSSTILNINPLYAFSHLEIYDANGNHSVATTDYVNDNFVTKAFFNRLFQAYSSSNIVDANKVSPNDTTTAINNLKILVGTWTEQYLSALGNNPSSGGQDTFNADLMWQELSGSASNHVISNSHLDLSGYALRTDLDSFVKSIKVGDQTKIPNANGLVDLGSIAADGYVTPITAGQVNTAKGDGKVWFKRASKTSDNTPNNGFVIEYGTSTNWVGQLYLGDNGTQGIYWGGWNYENNELKREAWKKIAFTSDLDNYTKTSDFKSLTIKVGTTSVVTYSPTSATELSIKAGTGITINNATNEITIARNQLQASDIPNLSWGKITSDKPTTLAGYGITDAKIENGVITLGSNTITPLTDAKIKSDYTWWGQQLQTTNNKTEVKGILSNATGIRLNNTGSKFGWIDFHYASAEDFTSNIYEYESGKLQINGVLNVVKGGNVGISNTDPACKLHVSGTGCMTGGLVVGQYKPDNHLLYVRGTALFENSVYVKNSLTVNNDTSNSNGAFIKIGKLFLIYDNNNNAIKVSGSSDLSENTSANFYATGAVSALGSQSSGGQDTFNADLMWQELGTNSTAKLIPQSHLNLSGYALTSEVTKTLTIKNNSGNVLGTYDGTQEKTITISGVSGNYLPLTGGTLSGNVDLKYTSIDATKNGNNVSSTQYPSSFSILDSGGRIITRTESVVEPESNSNGGRIGWYSYVRQYDSTHNTNNNYLAQRGIKYMLSKSLVGTWTVDDAPSFRSALGINLDNLVTTNTTQTITGLKTFEYSVTDRNTPLLKLNDKGTINESRLIWALRPNMTSQQWGEISIGKSATSKNLGQLAYKHVGDGSNNNFISLGIYGVGAGLCVYGNKGVYIGGSVDEAPSSTLHVNGTFYASGDSSIGGKLLVGASSTDYRMHVKGGIVCEYDGTYKGSFRSVRGNFMGSFGVNASGYTVFIASDGDGNNGTAIMSLTPYNATDKYAIFPHNVRVGYADNTAVDGAYVKIGGANLIWDDSSQLLKCDKLDSVTISTAQTITGVKTFNSAIGVNGGLTPLGTGTVGTANGGSKVWFKRVSSSEAPNNGFVIEYGNSTSWVGQLYVGDNATQGLYWNGWSDGVRGSWTKLAFVSDNVASATKLNDTITRKFWGQAYWQNGKPVSADVTGALNGTDDITITKANNVAFRINGTNYQFGLHLGSGGTNRGIYDFTSSVNKWLLYFDASNTILGHGNVGIGTGSPQYKLEVVGNSYLNGQVGIGGFSQNAANKLYVNGKSYLNGNVELSSANNTYIKIGGATLKWTGTALECDKDFYSTGAVSALGSNTSGGGGSTSDISVDVSLSGTTLTVNVSGVSDSVNLSSISGTSGNYIPLSGSDAITGDLKPASNDAKDLGNSQGNRWRQIHGQEFVGETVSLLENKIELNFRATQHNNFGCKVGYRTYGDEALVFANKNASTSFIFYTGSELITDENNTYIGGSYGTPALQIKQNSVYINMPIMNGVSPSYELYVNGRSYADEVWVGKYQDTRDVYFKRYNTQGGGILDIMAPQGARLNATTTVTSDMRLKNIVSFVDNLTVEGVAKAPIFNFKWKDRPKGFTSVGTSAQYWQSTLPNVVIDLDNILSLDYGATALASAVITARKVVDHELRVKQLEERVYELEQEINKLKAA